MSAALHMKIIQENLLLSVWQLCLPHWGFVFLQDNDPTHITKVIKKWFWDNNINLLEWPSQSPEQSH